MNVLLDTNALLIPGQFKVDVFAELDALGARRLCTLTAVVREVEKLAASRGRAAAPARVGLLLLKKHHVEVLFSRTLQTDAELVRVAVAKRMALCTQDRALIARCTKAGVPVITLRQRRYLIMK